MRWWRRNTALQTIDSWYKYAGGLCEEVDIFDSISIVLKLENMNELSATSETGPTNKTYFLRVYLKYKTIARGRVKVNIHRKEKGKC